MNSPETLKPNLFLYLTRRKAALEGILKRGGAHLRRICVTDGIDDYGLIHVALEHCADTIEEIRVEILGYHEFPSVARMLRDLKEYNPVALRSIIFKARHKKLTLFTQERNIDDPLSLRITCLEINFAKDWYSVMSKEWYRNMSANDSFHIAALKNIVKFIGLAIQNIGSLETVKLTFEGEIESLTPGSVFKAFDHGLADYGYSTDRNLSYENHKRSGRECLDIIIDKDIGIDDEVADQNFGWFLSRLKRKGGGCFSGYTSL